MTLMTRTSGCLTILITKRRNIEVLKEKIIYVKLFLLFWNGGSLYKNVSMTETIKKTLLYFTM